MKRLIAITSLQAQPRPSPRYCFALEKPEAPISVARVGAQCAFAPKLTPDQAGHLFCLRNAVCPSSLTRQSKHPRLAQSARLQPFPHQQGLPLPLNSGCLERWGKEAE